MDYRPALSFDRLVIAPKRHLILKARRLAIQELAQYPFVMSWKGSKTRDLIERAFEQKGLPCQITLETGGWEVIKQYVTRPRDCRGPLILH
jgi:hypothetical protein